MQKENSFKTKATYHLGLIEKRGFHIKERCNYCGTIRERNINRLHAELLILITRAAFLLAVILALFLLNFGWIVGLVYSIPFLAWKQKDIRARAFNNITVSDKTN